MIEITPKAAKKYSRIGSRAAYGQAMAQLVEETEDVYAITADLGGSSGLSRLMESRPDRVLNVGIAEQNLVGVAAGLAKEGLIPFASSFAPFMTHRCLDQIRMNMGYMKLPIHLVGLGSGFAMGELGYSHYGLEDIAVLRALPNITIINPCDCIQLIQAVFACSRYNAPTYIRLTGTVNVPIVYDYQADFSIGKGIVLKEGKNVAIIAAGSMVPVALEAAERLSTDGITATVVDMHTIKPLDVKLVAELFSDHEMVVTVEEHSKIGGLGSAVAEEKINNDYHAPQMVFGTSDEYGLTGDYDFQLERCGLTAENIYKQIKKKMED